MRTKLEYLNMFKFDTFYFLIKLKNTKNAKVFQKSSPRASQIIIATSTQVLCTLEQTPNQTGKQQQFFLNNSITGAQLLSPLKPVELSQHYRIEGLYVGTT